MLPVSTCSPHRTKHVTQVANQQYVCINSNSKWVWTIYLISDNSQLALLCIWALLHHIVDKSKELLHDCVLPHVIIARLDLQATPQHACCYTLWIMCSSIIVAAGMLLACEKHVI